MDQITITNLIKSSCQALPSWKNAGIETRLQVLQNAAAALRKKQDQFFHYFSLEGFSSDQLAYWGPLAFTLLHAELLEAYARELVQIRKTPRGVEILTRRPDGLVILSTPGNAPTINMLTIFTILLPGNAVIVRSPVGNQGTHFLLHEILHPSIKNAGFSPDIIHLIQGKTRDILSLLYKNPAVNTIVFFGNSSAGEQVAKTAQTYGKKVVLELEGNDHMILWKDAPLSIALEDALRAFDVSAQLCLTPKHFLVHPDIFTSFLAGLLERISHMKTITKDPTHGVLAPVTRIKEYFATLKSLTEFGGEVKCGGYQMNQDGTPDPKGKFIAPTIVVLSPQNLKNEIFLHQEFFFPLITVTSLNGSDMDIARAMSQMITRSSFGLRASIWTNTPEIIAHFTHEISSVGLLFFNEEHGRPPCYASPWGGTRKSGGPYGENHFFWEKTSHRQSIVCTSMTKKEIQAVLKSLGALEQV